MPYLFSLLFYGLNIKADGTESVIAGNHCRMCIFHPSVKEVATALCQCGHEPVHAGPRFITKTVGLLTVDGDKFLAQNHVTGVLNGVFVPRYQILIFTPPNGGNLYFFHGIRNHN